MFFPSATYRVQLNSSYTFKHLKQIIPYLDKLGISTVYASPITKATKGSTHGYDLTDPQVINPEIGTQKEFEEIIALLQQYNMSWLQDIVPNHMAFVTENERLMDVLERGEDSPYYNYFDINWNHFNSALKGKLMVPFLGCELKECVENKEVRLAWNDKGFTIPYFNDHYPVSISSYAFILEGNASDNLQNQIEELIIRSKGLPLNEWNEYKSKWVKDISADINSKELVDQAVNSINENTHLLEQLLQQQHHLLSYWKLTEKEINYRRFFTVNSLICLRMEDEAVFAEYHQLLHKLYGKGLFQGLRIDHIDGLYNPKQYVSRLRNLFGKDCYIIAEKILEYNENIASDWDLQGTSGYEFLSYTSQLLTDKKGGEQLLDFYKELLPGTKSYEDLVFDNKLNFLYSQMGGELDNLMHYMQQLQLLRNNEHSKKNIRKVLAIFMASFPVYRIYPDGFPLNEESREFVTKAFQRASEKGTELSKELQWLQSVFNTDAQSKASGNKLLFLMRLMQFTSPLAAKGVEDTTFYVYNPMISHNEVGDAPLTLGITIEEFHQKMLSRQKQNPYSLNTTSTHDTKRGEDARMRLNVLSELTGEWKQLVTQWRSGNKQFIQQVNGAAAPSLNDEYFIYQSLIGGFPEDLQITEQYMQRLHAFIQKAVREAKVHTNYSEPNVAYENACKQFISSILSHENNFLKTFVPFIKKIMQYASVYSMVQALIKITAPGIPDIYQGCELWDLSFVDPDNRRPVDYNKRMQMLDAIIEKEKQNKEEALFFISQQKTSGAQKLFTTCKAISFRRNNNQLFINGKYIPLQTNSSNNNIVAYARHHNNKWALIIVPVALIKNNNEKIIKRVSITLPQDAPTQWFNQFTGEIIQSNGTLSLAKVFSKFPLALLTNVE